MIFTATTRRLFQGLAVASLLPATAQGQTMPKTEQAIALPTRSEVELNLGDDVQPEFRQASERLYDFVRARLIETGMGYPIAADILSYATKGDKRAFDHDAFRHPAAWYAQRPSVLAQLCWRGDLKRIAGEAEVYPAPVGSVRAMPVPDSDPDAEIMPSRRPPDGGFRRGMVAKLSGALSGLDAFAIDCPGGAPSPLAGPFRWKRPVRIEATGDSATDARIAVALARVRKEVPGAPIDGRSFPAKPGTGNLHFGTDADLESSYRIDFAFDKCLPDGTCRDIDEIVGAGTATSPRRHASTRDFLASSYLSRPYYPRFGDPMALVEVAPRGEIVAALCGFDATSPGDKVGEREAQAGVTACLAQALGAFPAEEDPGADFSPEQYSRRLIARVIADLNRIY